MGVLFILLSQPLQHSLDILHRTYLHNLTSIFNIARYNRLLPSNTINHQLLELHTLGLELRSEVRELIECNRGVIVDEQVEHLPQVPLSQREVWRDCKYNHLTIRVAHPGLELRSAEREQWQGEHTTIGRKSEWIILGSLLAEVLSICFSKLRSNMLTAKYCRAATVSASPFIRTRHKKRRATKLLVLKTCAVW